MSIIDKMAKALHAKESDDALHTAWEDLLQQEKDWYREDAQAAWDVVKAKMLGDDVVKTMLIAFMFNLEIGAEDFEATSNALFAAIKKLEE